MDIVCYLLLVFTAPLSRYTYNMPRPTDTRLKSHTPTLRKSPSRRWLYSLLRIQHSCLANVVIKHAYNSNSPQNCCVRMRPLSNLNVWQSAKTRCLSNIHVNGPLVEHSHNSGSSQDCCVRMLLLKGSNGRQNLKTACKTSILTFTCQSRNLPQNGNHRRESGIEYPCFRLPPFM